MGQWQKRCSAIGPHSNSTGIHLSFESGFKPSNSAAQNFNTSLEDVYIIGKQTFLEQKRALIPPYLASNSDVFAQAAELWLAL